MQVETAPAKAKLNLANRQIDAFLKRFGETHLYLAYHAAFPLALTPDLLYRLWANFQRDSHEQTLNIPWIAVSDILLHLCDEVGHELYEMDRSVRQELLQRLQDSPQFGLARLRELADFVLIQVEPHLHSLDPDLQEFAKTQKWGALAYKQPATVAKEIALLLTQLNFDEKNEWVRLSGLLDSLSAPLADYSTLQVYTQAMADFVRGRLQAAVAKIQTALDSQHQLQAAGVNLPIPEQILAALPPLSAPTKPESLWLTWLKRYRWQIGGGIISLALVGVVAYLYETDRLPFLNSSNNQPSSELPPNSPSPATASSPSPTPSQPSPTFSPLPFPSVAPSQTPSQSVDQNLNDTPNLPDSQSTPAILSPSPSVTPSSSPTATDAPATSTQPNTGNGSGTTNVPANNDSTQSTDPGTSIPVSPSSTNPSELTSPGNGASPTQSSQPTLTLQEVQRQQQEIAAEIATLRGRVDALEGAVANYEAGQFTRAPDPLGQARTELSSIREEITQIEQEIQANIRAIVNLSSDSSVSQEDSTPLQRLNEEFAAELAALLGRYNSLNSRLNTLSSGSSSSPSPSTSTNSVLTQGEIRQVTGTVTIISSNGSSRAAQTGDILVTGDTLRTGANSSAQLVFNEGSIVRIDANTTLRMTPGLRRQQLSGLSNSTDSQLLLDSPISPDLRPSAGSR